MFMAVEKLEGTSQTKVRSDADWSFVYTVRRRNRIHFWGQIMLRFSRRGYYRGRDLSHLVLWGLEGGGG